MSLLTNLFAGKPGAKAASSPETAPVKMNLEERMAFRREMLYEAIKVTMKACGMTASAYKFRVVRNDKRGHQYSARCTTMNAKAMSPVARWSVYIQLRE